MHVEIVGHENFDKTLPLIAAYQRFYGKTPDDEKNRAYFSRYLDDHATGVLFVAIDDDGTAVGFATLYFVPSSLSAETAVVFNDLYTVPDVRSKGVGVALGVRAFEHARERGFKSISWLTSPENKKAQPIYEWTNAQRSVWYMYELSFGDG